MEADVSYPMDTSKVLVQLVVQMALAEISVMLVAQHTNHRIKILVSKMNPDAMLKFERY